MGQIAIEREVGFLAVYFGPRLVKQVETVLGKDVADKLSFLNEHVAVDVGHTLLNEKMLAGGHRPARPSRGASTRRPAPGR